MFYCALRNNHKFLRILLSHGAYPGILDTFGFSPLQMAILNENLEIVKDLIDNQADVNVKNKRNSTLLEIALREDYTENSGNSN